MRNHKLRNAIRTTSVAAALGLAASSVSAIEFSAGGYDADVFGYARLNASYDFDNDIASSTRAGDFSNLSTDTGNDGHFGADAFQSRLGVSVTTPQDVKIFVLGDFRGSGGGGFRLREAYGEYKGFLAGRTWSNFTGFVSFTPTLDFDSVPGLSGQLDLVTQVRYTTGPFSFSLEDNYFPTLLDAPADAKNSLPTATARFNNSVGAFSYAAAVLLQQIEFDEGNSGGQTDDTAFGYATFIEGALELNDVFTIRGSLTYTDGGNNHLYRAGDSGFGGEVAYVDGSGSLETISGYGGSAGISANLGGGRSVNLSYGLAKVDLDDANDAGINVDNKSETNSAVMLNYQWTPVQNVTMGVEYAFFEREDYGGQDGDASRLLFAAQYDF